MIPKYTLPEMASIWSDHHVFELWLRVEIAVAEAWHEVGEVPDWAVSRIRDARFDEDQIAEYEAETRHDMIAFLRSVNNSLGDAGRFVHVGLTSSDVKDTALSLQMLEARQLIADAARSLASTLGELAISHRDTLMMGRTHGIHAEPTTLGFKFAVWYDDLQRALGQLDSLGSQLSVAKLTGAVGTHSNVPPNVEEDAARRLGLTAGAAETQVIQRDRHARFVLELAVLGSIVDMMATEVRFLQRTEIGEVQEPFEPGQEGSSAMPHKRNPLLSERVSGLSRVLRGYAVPALEDIVLWNERDLTNSSTERIILPDATCAMHYALTLFKHVMRGLTVFPERMRQNVELTQGVVFSQRVLLALIEAGLPRAEAYRIVQRDALAALDQRIGFQSTLCDDPDVLSKLSREELSKLFDYSYFVRNVPSTFQRLGLA